MTSADQPFESPLNSPRGAAAEALAMQPGVESRFREQLGVATAAINSQMVQHVGTTLQTFEQRLAERSRDFGEQIG